ncbi:lasso peptide biosynthesis B2 protein [Amycolatopsis sp. WAC 01375]|uniref:lasso peptide biosynthesis B2 protein n=1 Tax=unclassified Amycolatopsis TaxID=2618356 RepID=UPI000F7A5851|nr:MULTISPECIES: lasso peptide biosynthesis B2 protein [unclassified Amycolatopsis]RSM78407.1 lasso peptide biosynthesis B2 protein [Amycolatopsis sp. WAC 01375]RSN30871.1 lasso peptide biosynthesis B2 protein [Amycolatopsis sp. WAC 01416]
MTTPSALSRPRSLPFGRRLAARQAVAVARLIAMLPPHRIRLVFGVLRRGARPATREQAEAAREAVLAVSLVCLGPKGCLPRSLAVTLLCRLRGVWPTWCVGVRARPPFGAHAWVEVDGQPVGEGVSAGYFARLVAVGPPDRVR